MKTFEDKNAEERRRQIEQLQQTIIQTQIDLDQKTQIYNALNQTKLELLTKQTKIEQLNFLLGTLKRKYGQARNDLNAVKVER